MISDNELYLQISVIDTGKGIKKEDQNKLFKLFGYVEDAQGLNTHGIGLGLVISQKIINQFDGQISMTSEYGVGSEFTFILKINNKNEKTNCDGQIEEQKLAKCDNGGLNFSWKPKFGNKSPNYRHTTNLDGFVNSNFQAFKKQKNIERNSQIPFLKKRPSKYIKIEGDMTLSSQTLFGNKKQIPEILPSIEVLWSLEQDDQ